MSQDENKELIRYRFNKALETIEEAAYLLEGGYWNNTVNRLYYACYYAVSALLASIDIYPKTHAGTKQMFSFHFINEGRFKKETYKFYSQLFEMRQDADYEDFVDYEKDDVEILITPAKELIEEIGQLLWRQEK